MNEVEKIIKQYKEDNELFWDTACCDWNKHDANLAKAIDEHYKEQWKEVFEVYGLMKKHKYGFQFHKDHIKMVRAIKTCVGRCGDEGNI